MEGKRRFMLGNLVMINGKVNRVVSVNNDSWISAVDTETELESTYGYDMIRPIALNDSFFTDNGYEFDVMHDDKDGKITNIIPGDHTGPAVTKYEFEPWHHRETEYCVTGIIVRTVDEFQNIMNVCGCQDIADKIKVRQK